MFLALSSPPGRQSQRANHLGRTLGAVAAIPNLNLRRFLSEDRKEILRNAPMNKESWMALVTAVFSTTMKSSSPQNYLALRKLNSIWEAKSINANEFFRWQVGISAEKTLS